MSQIEQTAGENVRGKTADYELQAIHLWFGFIGITLLIVSWWAYGLKQDLSDVKLNSIKIIEETYSKTVRLAIQAAIDNGYELLEGDDKGALRFEGEQIIKNVPEKIDNSPSEEALRFLRRIYSAILKTTAKKQGFTLELEAEGFLSDNPHMQAFRLVRDELQKLDITITDFYRAYKMKPQELPKLLLQYDEQRRHLLEVCTP